MNLSAPFIHRPVMTTLVMIALAFLGVMAYFNLTVSNLPDVNYPTINVTATLPGASPETMANTVATPLEKQFMTIPGVLDVSSSNTLGNTNIVVQFDVTKDVDLAAVDIQTAISQAKAKLPRNLPQDPTFRKSNPSDTPIIYIALTSATEPLGKIYDLANTLVGQRISTVEGVAQVFVYGSPYAVRVQVDPLVLSSLGLTLTDVSSALSSANQDQPTGQLDGREISSIINTSGQLKNAAVYEPIFLKYGDGAGVQVQDVGYALDSTSNDRQTEKFVDGKDVQAAVVLAVLRQPGANTVKVAEAISAYLPKLRSQIPGSVEMKILFDRSVPIKESIEDVKFTLLLALFLVVGVIFLYLGKIKETIIPSLVMPMSIISTFIVMYLLNYSLDNLSLLALTLAVGFIVDDAIVVIENIDRKVDMGMSLTEAALEGSKQISFTIVSMTLSLIAVFIPMLFMGGLIGKLFHEFAITLSVVTLFSGIISLTLTPMLASRFTSPRDKEKKSRVGEFSERMNKAMLNVYSPALKWILGHRFIAVIVGVLSIIFSVILFKILPIDFIPDEDIGFVIAYIEGEQGTSSTKMKEYQQKFIEMLQEVPEISAFISIVSNKDFRQGINFLRLVPHDQRKSSTQLIQELMVKSAQIPGLRAYFKNVPLIDLSIGSQTKGAYQYTLSGLDTKELYASAEKLMTKMLQEPGYFQSVTSDLEVKTPQLFIDILREQASSMGVNAADIENTLLLAYSGNRISLIDTSLDQYDLVMEVMREFQQNTETFHYVFVRNNNTNEMLPLSSVINWKESVGPNSINHLSQFPAVTITFNIPPGVALGTALSKINELSAESLSEEVSGFVKGAGETFLQSLESASYLLLYSVLAIYIILGILYESFLHPLTILSTLPPAILGGLATLWILGMPLSLYGFLGIILLVGIVKKNGIMMVDYALDFVREKKESAENAIYDACMVRFRPIMMTTVAAIAGALPIALGMGAATAARRPLGLVIIGGMLFSQLITLFLTPVIYLYIEEWKERHFPAKEESVEVRSEVSS